jgi:nucleolar pre-ribosomal-associated protein 1
MRFLIVLSDPLHFLYIKVNKFLNRAPRWDLAKLPSYWVDKILLHPPDSDNAFYQEVEWLLDALTNGLRTYYVSSTRRGNNMN